jgi:hypothetical protein
MNKKKLVVLILGAALVLSLVAVIIFFVKKYENESLPQSQPVQPHVIAPQNPLEVKPQDSQDPSGEERDNQFSTENGKLLQ